MKFNRDIPKDLMPSLLKTIWGKRIYLVAPGLILFILSWLFSFYRYEEIFRWAVVLPFICFCVKDCLSAAFKSRILQFVLLFLVYMFGTVLVRELQDTDLVSLWAGRTGATLVFLLSVFWVAAHAKRDLLGWGYIAGSFIAAVASIINYFSYYSTPGGGFRLYCIFSQGHPVPSGWMFLMAASWALILMLRSNRIWLLIPALCALCASLAALSFTFSRGNYLAMFAMMISMLILVRTKKAQWLFVISAWILIVSFSTLAIMDCRLREQGIDGWGRCGFSRVVGAKSSGRINAYKDLLEKTEGSFVFGTGLHSNNYFEFHPGLSLHPHSIPLWVLYHGGIVGFSIYALMLGVVFWAGLKTAWAHKSYSILLLIPGVAALVFDGAYLIHSAYSREWLLYWLPIALIAAESEKTNDGRTEKHEKKT